MAFSFRSPAFDPEEDIPRQYARDGENVSPPLEWSGTPKGTKSFAVMVDDPDAPKGTFHHWALYNIAPDRTGLPEGVGVKREHLGIAVNDFGNAQYDGPQPPKGDRPHRYHFHIAALDIATIRQKPSATVEDVWNATRGHVLAEAEFIGTYAR